MPPWQFLVRAAMVITGLVLLLVVDVHGVVFFVAWALIVLALVGEALGTLVYWARSRPADAPLVSAALRSLAQAVRSGLCVPS